MSFESRYSWNFLPAFGVGALGWYIKSGYTSSPGLSGEPGVLITISTGLQGCLLGPLFCYGVSYMIASLECTSSLTGDICEPLYIS